MMVTLIYSWYFVIINVVYNSFFTFNQEKIKIFFLRSVDCHAIYSYTETIQ
ncbi:hypothetical protein FQR65_LT07091 [Abscondita terminalis]|nr:hypothetical protein FQR65_LT07091 [Abscondita terminalis]